jgi:hypothetical protein
VGAVALLASLPERFRANEESKLLLVALGILSGVALMLRPQFIFLPIILGLYVAWISWRFKAVTLRLICKQVFLVICPGVFLIIGWSSFNYFELGRFTISAQTGVNLTEHTIAFVELAPEKYRQLRDILVKYRDVHIAQTGRHTATWEAVPELRKVTGLSQAGLDAELVQMSMTLITQHPLRYAALVGQSWIGFWLVTNPPGLKDLRPVAAVQPLTTVWRVEHVMLRAVNAAFLFLVPFAFASSRVRVLLDWEFVRVGICSIVITSSLVQALSVGVDNTRYAVTVQPLIGLFVLIAIWRVTSQWCPTNAAIEYARIERGSR